MILNLQQATINSQAVEGGRAFSLLEREFEN